MRGRAAHETDDAFILLCGPASSSTRFTHTKRPRAIQGSRTETN